MLTICLMRTNQFLQTRVLAINMLASLQNSYQIKFLCVVTQTKLSHESDLTGMTFLPYSIVQRATTTTDF